MSASRFAPLLGALWALWALPSTAADFQVTHLADSDPPSAGSLRAAVQAANASPGPDRILFAVDGTVQIGTELVITDAVEILGRGRDKSSIDGQGISRIFRIVGDINRAGAVAVTLRGLTLARGASGVGSGGAVAAVDFAKLRIEDCTVRNSSSSAASGGAIYVSESQLDVIASILSDNHAHDNGGAIAAQESDLFVDRSTLRFNGAMGGGAVYAEGVNTRAQLSGSRIESNTASTTGGGLSLSLSTVELTGVTLMGNSAEFAGGGVYLLGTASGSLVIQNSTLSGNLVQQAGGHGSGIELSEGTLWLRNSTVAYNRAPGAATNDATLGGGIHVAEGGHTLNLVSTLVAENVRGASNVPSELVRGVGADGSISTINASHSLIFGIPDPGTLNGTDAANVIGADPLLLPLADNGGPTPTFAIDIGSPACERGENPAGLATDQRGPGFSRGYGRTDIGAYEYRGDTIFYGDFELHDPQEFGCARRPRGPALTMRDSATSWHGSFLGVIRIASQAMPSPARQEPVSGALPSSSGKPVRRGDGWSRRGGSPGMVDVRSRSSVLDAVA